MGGVKPTWHNSRFNHSDRSEPDCLEWSHSLEGQQRFLWLNTGLNTATRYVFTPSSSAGAKQIG